MLREGGLPAPVKSWLPTHDLPIRGRSRGIKIPIFTPGDFGNWPRDPHAVTRALLHVCMRVAHRPPWVLLRQGRNLPWR